MSSTTTINSYYVPNNAVIAASGDYDAEALPAHRGGVRRHRGRPDPAPVTAIEPPQRAARRVEVRRPAPTAVVRMAYRSRTQRIPRRC